MSEHEITREVGGAQGRYVIAKDGLEAELAYSIASPSLIVANHTGVPVAWRSKGIALALAQRLVSDAKAEGVKIVPTCSYVDHQRKRHPEWADVFAD